MNSPLPQVHGSQQSVSMKLVFFFFAIQFSDTVHVGQSACVVNPFKNHCSNEVQGRVRITVACGKIPDVAWSQCTKVKKKKGEGGVSIWRQ